MVIEKLHVVQLRNDFYRDGFQRIIFSFTLIAIACAAFIAAVLYLHFSKPAPIYFAADNQWRTVAPIPVTEGSYPIDSDLKQWLSSTLQSIFKFSFVNYDDALRKYRIYFTDTGWQVFQGFVDKFAAKTMVENTKAFVNGAPTAAPSITRDGLIADQKRYGWWLEVPVSLSYVTPTRSYTQSVTLNILVVRIPTLDNLYGIAIENILLVPGQTFNSFQGGTNA